VVTARPDATWEKRLGPNMAALMALPVVAGLTIGRLRGGRLRGLLLLRLRAVWLVWVAVAVQVCQKYAPGLRRLVEDDLGVPMLALVFAAVGAWLVVNLPRRALGIRIGIAVIVLGGVLNGAAIFANGRMPFSVHAARLAGVPDDGLLAVGPKNEPATPATRLAWLGDVIPVRPVHKVISAGDVAIMTGVVLLISTGMGTRPGAQPGGRGPGGQPGAAWSRRRADAARTTGEKLLQVNQDANARTSSG
jgi:hypothetical protein